MISGNLKASDVGPKVLFVVEGYTDIRFVTALAEVSRLTLLVPKLQYESSGLGRRVADCGLGIDVVQMPGGRIGYQLASARWLWRQARRFDVLVTQELLRGTLNAALIGRLRGRPVLAQMGIPPVEYYRCRRLRGQSRLKSWLGEAVIRTLLQVNGRLVTSCVANGTYLETVARRTCKHVHLGHCYGVDMDLYRPVSSEVRDQLRKELGFPPGAFVVFSASRFSHEKDPETALKAVARLRSDGIDAVIINLGGGYRDFLELAERLQLPGCKDWVLGRPAEHPMNGLQRYFQAVDVLLQCSLEEGLGMTPLEALACGTPAVATAVGGLGATLPGYARLAPRADVAAVAAELRWVRDHPREAVEQAMRGRQFVEQRFSRRVALASWSELIEWAMSRSAPGKG